MEISIGFKIFPLSFSNSSVVEIEIVATGFTLTKEEIGLIDAINTTIIGDLKSTKPGKGRQKINGGKNRV